MIPTFSHPGGATAASSTASVTQLSADRIAAAAPPASDLCQIQATANSAAVIAIDPATRPRLTGNLLRTPHASAAAASGGTATSARYVSAVAVSERNRIANTTTTIDA